MALNEFFNAKWVTAEYGNSGLPVRFNTIMLCHFLPDCPCPCQVPPGHSLVIIFPALPPSLCFRVFLRHCSCWYTQKVKPWSCCWRKTSECCCDLFFLLGLLLSHQNGRHLMFMTAEPYKRVAELRASSLWYSSFRKSDNDMSRSDWTFLWLGILLFFWCFVFLFVLKAYKWRMREREKALLCLSPPWPSLPSSLSTPLPSVVWKITGPVLRENRVGTACSL